MYERYFFQLGQMAGSAQDAFLGLIVIAARNWFIRCDLREHGIG
jgi:hypothetical protein